MGEQTYMFSPPPPQTPLTFFAFTKLPLPLTILREDLIFVIEG